MPSLSPRVLSPGFVDKLLNTSPLLLVPHQHRSFAYSRTLRFSKTNCPLSVFIDIPLPTFTMPSAPAGQDIKSILESRPLKFKLSTGGAKYECHIHSDRHA